MHIMNTLPPEKSSKWPEATADIVKHLLMIPMTYIKNERPGLGLLALIVICVTIVIIAATPVIAKIALN